MNASPEALLIALAIPLSFIEDDTQFENDTHFEDDIHLLGLSRAVLGPIDPWYRTGNGRCTPSVLAVNAVGAVTPPVSEQASVAFRCRSSNSFSFWYRSSWPWR